MPRIEKVTLRDVHMEMSGSLSDAQIWDSQASACGYSTLQNGGCLERACVEQGSWPFADQCGHLQTKVP